MNEPMSGPPNTRKVQAKHNQHQLYKRKITTRSATASETETGYS